MELPTPGVGKNSPFVCTVCAYSSKLDVHSCSCLRNRHSFLSFGRAKNILEVGSRSRSSATAASIMLSPLPFLLSTTMASLFPNRLPESRLGKAHVTLADFQKEIQFTPSKTKEYSLIMVTEPKTQRILLGRKHRGFGAGMLNSFGGKLEPNESILSCAVRELEEETGIRAEEKDLLKTGTLHFTIQDDPLKMLVYVYRLNVDCYSIEDYESPYVKLDPTTIRGCEEITPEWIENWHQIPLQEMFADDSLWLTMVLDSSEPLYVEGHFHFETGGQDVNSIRDYWMSMQPLTTIA